MNPATKTHIFQLQSDFRLVAEIADFGGIVVISISCSGKFDPCFNDDFLAWYVPILDAYAQKTKKTYFNGVLISEPPFGTGI